MADRFVCRPGQIWDRLTGTRADDKGKGAWMTRPWEPPAGGCHCDSQPAQAWSTKPVPRVKVAGPDW